MKLVIFGIEFMTITEKILAKHAGKTKVEPGENIWIDVDI